MKKVILISVILISIIITLFLLRNQFCCLEEPSASIQEQIRQEILDDLGYHGKKLSFPVTNINIEKGKSKDLPFGIKNINENSLTYNFKISAEAGNSLEFFYDHGTNSLNPMETKVHSLRISAIGQPGTYPVKLTINDLSSNSIYAETTFEVIIE